MPQQRARCVFSGLLTACGLAAPAQAQFVDRFATGHHGAPGVELVHVCWPGEHGTLTGKQMALETLTDENLAIREELNRSYRGDLPNRIDVVFVGDGYTAAQQVLFHADMDVIETEMFRYEPFITYKPFFRIQRVEVISVDSGVDNDPTQGINRNTALDMAFWCGGTERALCVNVAKALNAARAGVETDVDQVVAIANTTKYGGVGYPSSDLCTSSGRNGSATEIVIHELGHSLGNLADEYDYGGPQTYTGGELGPVDVSIYNQAQQVAQQRKWWRWMGATDTRFDGTVGAFEGANYSVFGVFRPTNNSMMRSLGRKFNLPSAEGLIKEFYREVRPIEDATPTTPNPESDAVLYAIPVQPDGHDLIINWFLDGEVIASAINQTHLDLSTLNLGVGEHTVSVTVVDPTPWVRDESIRTAFLTDTRQWTINPCTLLADLDNSGTLDFFDVSSFLLAFQVQDPVADFDNSGEFNFFDIGAFLAEFSNPCGN
jgi:hypothetical protein